MNVAVIQLCSVLDYKQNLQKINDLIQSVISENSEKIDAVFLPEVFYSISNGKEPTPYLIDGENEHFKNIQQIAKNFDVYLIGGTAATQVGDKIINRAYNFAPDGSLIDTYDKIHLFTLDLKKHDRSTIIDETLIYSPGNTPKLIDINEWKIGLGICFDLRFPELFRHYFSKGANILTVASAFTVPTGKAHWETLLRARAIETQSYVIAADQWGEHNEKTTTYGHSMIIDPWGEVIANAKEGEGVITAKLDFDHLTKIRKRLNVLPNLKF